MNISYASSFVTYLLTHLKNLNNVTKIILFGSIARNEATKESDVDLFIEIKKKTKKAEREIRNIEESFYQSREAALFKTQGIENKLSVKLGKLAEWKDLAESIASTGITLYGPYETSERPSGAQRFVIVFWNGIGKNRGSFLNKLYGVTVNNKHYDGLLARVGGKKLGKSCIMLPIASKKDMFRLLQEHKVQAKVQEVYSDD